MSRRCPARSSEPRRRLSPPPRSARRRLGWQRAGRGRRAGEASRRTASAIARAHRCGAPTSSAPLASQRPVDQTGRRHRTGSPRRRGIPRRRTVYQSDGAGSARGVARRTVRPLASTRPRRQASALPSRLPTRCRFGTARRSRRLLPSSSRIGSRPRGRSDRSRRRRRRSPSRRRCGC